MSEKNTTVMKKIYLAALCVAIVLIGVLVWKAGPQSSQAPQEEGTASQSVLGGQLQSNGDYQYSEDKSYYTIDITYPSETLLVDSEADVRAQTTMEMALKAQVDQFKSNSNLDSLTAADAQTQGLGGERRYALGIDYKVYEGTATVSYVYTIYADTLGAHPNTYYQTFTFDKRGNHLTLEKLFTPGSPYLSTLSKLTYPLVVAQLEKEEGVTLTPEMLDTVRLGTSPTPETLQFFYIDNSTLHLLFPPYQVAAYAAGAFDIAISLGNLVDIIDSDLFTH